MASSVLLRRVETSQGNIGQQQGVTIPNFGGGSSNSATYRSWDPASVPTPREIVKALNSFVIGQMPAKKVRCVYNLIVSLGMQQCFRQLSPGSCCSWAPQKLCAHDDCCDDCCVWRELRECWGCGDVQSRLALM